MSGIVGGAGGVTFSLVGTSTSNRSASINMPSGIQQYDWIFMLDYAYGSPALVVPSGWSNLRSDAYITNALRMTLNYKEAAGTESGASVTGMSTGGGEGASHIAVVFRPSVRAKMKGAFVATGVGGSNSGDQASYNIVSAGGHTGLLLACLGATNNNPAFTTLTGHDALITNNDTTNFGNTKLAHAISNGDPKTMTADPASATRYASFGIWQEFEPF